MKPARLTTTKLNINNFTVQDVQKLLAEEFPSMRHVRTSSLHKGVSTARHAFLTIPGLDNKLDHLAQVSCHGRCSCSHSKFECLL